MSVSDGNRAGRAVQGRGPSRVSIPGPVNRTGLGPVGPGSVRSREGSTHEPDRVFDPRVSEPGQAGFTGSWAGLVGWGSWAGFMGRVGFVGRVRGLGLFVYKK